MNAIELTYDETEPRDRELFAEMVASLQSDGAKFTVRRRGGTLFIEIFEGAR
jgi:hypothetical protein